MKKISLFSLLLCTAILLCSCNKLIKLEVTSDGYLDEKNGVNYIAAPVCYEPAALGDEYAYYKSSGGTEVKLHTVGELDPKLWLSESYAGIGSLYYADTVTPPTLTEFDTETILVCVEDVITMHLQTIDNASAVERIMEHIRTSEPVEMPMDGVKTYHLKLTSKTLDGIYYSILYIVTADGSAYYLDRSAKTAYPADDTMAGYIYVVDDEVMENDGNLQS